MGIRQHIQENNIGETTQDLILEELRSNSRELKKLNLLLKGDGEEPGYLQRIRNLEGAVDTIMNLPSSWGARIIFISKVAAAIVAFCASVAAIKKFLF